MLINIWNTDVWVEWPSPPPPLPDPEGTKVPFGLTDPHYFVDFIGM